MLALTITRNENGTYTCNSGWEHRAVATWLELELGDDGWSYDEGSLIEELFENIGKMLAGTQEMAQAWADVGRVTVTGRECDVTIMSISRCIVSLDDLVGAVLQWFDVVNPTLAASLRRLQATWPTGS